MCLCKRNILKGRLYCSLKNISKTSLMHYGSIENSWLLFNKEKDVSEHGQLHALSSIEEVDLIKDFKALVLLFEKRYAYFFSQQSKIIEQCWNSQLWCKIFSRYNNSFFSSKSEVFCQISDPWPWFWNLASLTKCIWLQWKLIYVN